MASMLGIKPVSHGTGIVGKGEIRADPIHLARIAWCRGCDIAPRKSQEMNYPGDDLSSQGVAPRVSSALESLTAVFGMGTGGSSPLASPG